MSSPIYDQLCLPQKNRDIRLLRLFPGDWEHDIYGEIRVANMDESSYWALSYAWGGGQRLRTLSLNGTQVSVTANLESALRRLRAMKILDLWVDALCINQADTSERNHQVALMRDIYHRSEEVIVWLGEETLTSSDSPTGSVRDAFATLKHILDWSDSLSTQLKTLAIGLETLMGVPWWTRTWVVQEIVVAQKAQIVYGSTTLEWAELATYAKVLDNHLEKCCAKVFDNLSADEQTALYNFINPLLDIESLRSQLANGRPYLLDLLRKFRSRLASDKRDKVFAFLGLGNLSRQEPIKVDYTMTNCEVYQEAALGLIRDTSSLQVLMCGSEWQEGSQFPSWVPDWSAPIPYPGLLAARLRQVSSGLYQASKGKAPEISIYGEPALFHLTGIAVDRISRVGEIMRPFADRADYKIGEDVRDWQKVMPPSSQEYVGGCYSNIAAFKRTMFTDLFFEESRGASRRLDERDSISWGTWWRSNAQGFVNPNLDFDGVDETLETATAMRRFFVTDQGWMGLGPAATCADDHVFVLFGGETPFILRHVAENMEVDQSNFGKPSRFSLVGDCFVQGIMDGEILDDSAKCVQTVSLI
ncbi:HET-domain-containing protein [Cadophora sp. DSE1049]|nr:HET-domain-containing protein [Cadophora sp. DSE1049]